MVQGLVIAAFVIVLLRGAIERPLLWGLAGSSSSVAVWTLAMMLGLWILADLSIRLLTRRIERRGSWVAYLLAERIVVAVGLLAIAGHAAAVLGLGWVDAVRYGLTRLLGSEHVVLVDELVAVAPPLLVIVGAWWSFSRVAVRLREATLLRELDTGLPTAPVPTRWQWLVHTVRHQMLLVLVPIVLIAAWRETLMWGSRRLGLEHEPWLFGVELAGIVGVLSIMPVVMCRVWDTVPLGAGELRERLLSMCRQQRVRVRSVLVWRTGGTMVNGAVMGFFGSLRYVLLTDALLERLQPRQVEAVMAHELGHVRRGHMLWLGLAGVGSIMLAAALAELVVDRLDGAVLVGGERPAWVDLASSLAALVTGFFMFGVASRRFEWQADAFAVQHLSGAVRGEAPRAVQGEAVMAMAGALDAVAMLNHIRPDRFSFRHGSIRQRKARLLSLAGRRTDRLPADFNAGVVKVASLGMIAAAVAIAWRMDAGAGVNRAVASAHERAAGADKER